MSARAATMQAPELLVAIWLLSPMSTLPELDERVVQGLEGAPLRCLGRQMHHAVHRGGDRTSLSPEPPEIPFLRWSFTTEPMPDSSEVWYHQDSVSWVSRGVALWETCLPERMRRHQAGIGSSEVEAYRDDPRQMHHLGFLIGLADLEDEVVIADGTGLLFLAKAAGAVRLDFEVPSRGAGGGERLWFDSGSYAISSAEGRWSGRAKGGRFLASCGTRLVYFNGSTLAVFSTSGPRLLGQVPYESSKHDARRGLFVSARISLLDLEVAIEGVIHVR